MSLLVRILLYLKFHRDATITPMHVHCFRRISFEFKLTQPPVKGQLLLGILIL